MGVLVAGVPAFVASLVEFVEAYTIVLAVGTTRGWRAPLWGCAAAAVTLGALVAGFGVALVDRLDEHVFELVIGSLLLLFGMKWLRKAILRYAGIVALHDEDLVYAREVAAQRVQGRMPTRFDWVGFATSYKAMLLEGLEVVFLVITLGARGREALLASSVGAAGAFLLVGVAGGLVRRPLTRVPENTLKFAVGAMLCSFGVYWAAEGLGTAWPGGALSLPALFAAFGALSWAAVRVLRRLVPGGRLLERAV